MKKAANRINLVTTCLLSAVAAWIGQSARATEYIVEMTSDWKFSPSYLEIQVGDIVTWVNHDYSYYLHDSVCAGYWNSGLLNVDQRASLRFPITGTFHYRDSTFYLFNMTGTIVSQAITPPSTPIPATLIDPMQLPGGAFQFTLSNLVVGATYVIQASADLANWSNLATNVASSSVESYVDNDATAAGRRFYLSWHWP